MKLSHLIASLPGHRDNLHARALHPEHCEVLLGSYPAGHAIEPSSRDRLLCGVVTRGEMLLTVNGATRRVLAGCWYEIPRGAVHEAVYAVDTTTIELHFRR